MSASLTAALICGVLRSATVTNALLVLVEDEDELLELLVELVGPPLIHWPTRPLHQSHLRK
jgi:hypothetical protein